MSCTTGKRVRGSVNWREDRSAWEFRYKGKKKLGEIVTERDQKKAAEKEAAKWFDEIDADAGKPNKGRITMNDLLDKHLDHMQLEGCSTTEMVRRKMMKNVRPLIGKMDPYGFKTAQAQQYHLERKNQGAKPATIRNEIAWIKTAINLGIMFELVDRAPLLYKFGTIKNARNGVVNDDDFSYCLKRMPAHCQLTLYIAAWSGLRHGELFSLRWEMIDWEHRIIAVPENIAKNDDAHEIPLIAPAWELLLLDHARQGYPKTGSLLQHEGKPMGQDYHRDQWEEARLGAPSGRHLLWHDFRRTFMGIANQAGIDDKTTRLISNHKTVEMADRYTIKNRLDILRARDAMDALYAQKEQKLAHELNSDAPTDAPEPKVIIQ